MIEETVLTVRPDDLRSGGAPPLPTWASITDDCLTVMGDDSGHRQVFVLAADDVMLAGTEPGEVVDAARQVTGLDVSPFAVSHMLQTGFVPMTATMFEGLRRIGMGDSLLARSRAGRFRYEERADYPWLTYKSRQDQVPDTTRCEIACCGAADTADANQ